MALGGVGPLGIPIIGCKKVGFESQPFFIITEYMYVFEYVSMHVCTVYMHVLIFQDMYTIFSFSMFKGVDMHMYV